MLKSNTETKQSSKQTRNIKPGTQLEIWEQKSEVETTKHKNTSRTYLRLLMMKSKLIQIDTPESKALQKKIGI